MLRLALVFIFSDGWLASCGERQLWLTDNFQIFTAKSAVDTEIFSDTTSAFFAARSVPIPPSDKRGSLYQQGYQQMPAAWKIAPVL